MDDEESVDVPVALDILRLRLCRRLFDDDLADCDLSRIWKDVFRVLNCNVDV